ncbi:MAG: MBOAT family protein, partial [Proteobacteria bacterium]|nr:MBOAT family protein [Pseudomonadota bacterium]
MSLIIDSYYRSKKKGFQNVNLAKHTQDTLLYTVFFPQLIAGPIVKWNMFSPQIGPKKISDIDWIYCARCLIIGYFLKIYVADNLTDTLVWFRYPYFLEKSKVTLWFSLFAYSIQIFADFGGYSLIALGLAGLFGYRLPVNFNAPYLARNMSDFWGRWHITLSQWLRQYLFNPLALSAKRKGRVGVSAFIAVMVLGGIWHGASWNFAIWGVLHGLFLTVAYYYSTFTKWKMPTILGIFLTFGCVSISWIFFAIPKFDHSLMYIQSLFHNSGPLDVGSYF